MVYLDGLYLEVGGEVGGEERKVYKMTLSLSLLSLISHLGGKKVKLIVQTPLGRRH